MKHPLRITLLLLFLFLCAQSIGLSLIYTHATITVEDGRATVSYGDTVIGPRPSINPSQTFWLVIIGVTIGTVVLLGLIKFRLLNLWKLWFFAAVFLSLYVAFGIIMPATGALVLALALGAWKVFTPNAVVHNLTELFVYAGIVILISPLFNLAWAALLLVIISLYDMYAVWKSKHMVTIAEAGTRNNLLAGLYIPKTKTLTHPAALREPRLKKGGVAVLGGGDIAFPLLFSSTTFTWLVNSQGVIPSFAFLRTGTISIACTLVLALLFWRSEKGRFYPAMPFLTLGCFLGLGIIVLL